MAEREIMGLVDLRKKYSEEQIFKGLRIAGCIHITFETAVLIETLVACGSEVRWCSSDTLSTNDYAAAALAKSGISVFGWKGKTPGDFKWCQEQTLKFKEGTLNLLIDDGGFIAALLYEKYPEMLEGLKGMVEQTTVGVS
ncbi:Adenosylhomocysteinase B [Thelohanellus kitauei]|uniref:Adenosylhomocysteinase B n=1 Tax=Thelohanellus kitauei TaxID=669202 RepID=A0A0C2J6C7_THEKT|nr:Adenosylhomocysteinase B [Thelohanellus kitauei]